ncbi:MAG: hypothetical protein JNJ54_36080, partial [Myxococcaceae bacterium]|nr:hypothetical protein [Myxococcaceae bacterium]
AGGSTAGGSTAGGSTAGGSTAGGSTAGGSTAGGSTAGGSTAGGSTAGGSTAGGSTAGGSAGGAVMGTGDSCQSPRLLSFGTPVQSTTAGRANNFGISTGSGCRGTASTGDVVYRVDVPAGAAASVSVNATWDVVLNAVQAPATNCGALVGMQTQNITCVAFADGNATGTESVVLSNPTNSPATYFVIIDGFMTGESGSFTVSAEVFIRPNGPTEVEPNDTRVLADATGQVLAPGTSVNADLGVSEADLFRINVPTAGVLRLTAEGFTCQGFSSVRLSLLDATAAVISTEDFSTASACRLMAAQVQPGTYYVSMARTATGTSVLPYWVSATLLTGRTSEVEPNDTTNQATLFTGQDTVICGALGTVTDFTDIFIFTLSQPARIQAELIESMAGSMPTCESNLITSRLELLSGAGLVLVSNTTGGRGSCSRVDEAAPLSAGTYFLRVTEVFSTTRRGFPYCVAVRLR